MSQNFKKSCFFLLAIASANLCYGGQRDWTNGSGDEKWSNPDNWRKGNIAGPGDTAIFNDLGGRFSKNQNVSVDVPITTTILNPAAERDIYYIKGPSVLTLTNGGVFDGIIIDVPDVPFNIEASLHVPQGISISNYGGPNNSILEISGPVTGTNFSLANSVTTPGIVNLSGNNTYTGNTTTGFNTLIVSGSITGSNSIVQDGGTLIVSGTVGSTNTNVQNNGTLKLLLGTITSTDTTVQSGAILTGNGTTGKLTNSGTVSPGDSIGTIKINEDFFQTSSGDLQIEITEDGTSDLINIIGAASLDGTLTLEPEPGLYPDGIRYTFMNYASRTGTLTLIEDTGLQFSIEYQGTFAELVNASSGPVLPTKRDRLRGIARRVADYLFCPGPLPINHDLITVMRALLKSPRGQFKSNLAKLSPAQFGALPLVNTQNNRLVADVIIQSTEKYNWCDPCQTKTNSQTNKRNTSVWVAPIGNYYSQEGIQNQVGFDSYAVGVGIGANHFFSNCVLFGGGVGYTYSEIDWDKNRGDGHIHSVYAGPSIGLVFERLYFNFLALGSFNHYDIDRKIQFPGINRTASNTHHSYDVLGRIDGGYKFRINAGGNQNKPYFIIPEVSVSYLNVFEEGYNESGADSINLSVDSKYSAFLQPNVLIKLLREVCTPSWCITPSFHAGWISNIPLTSGNYKASLYKQNLCQPNFVVKSFHRATNQLSVGVGLYLRSINDWIMDINVKTDCLDNSFVTSGNFKVEKRF